MGKRSRVGKKRRLMRMLLGIWCVALIMAGCASGGGAFQWRYHEDYTLSEKNRQALMNLNEACPLTRCGRSWGNRKWLTNIPVKPSGIIARGRQVL